MVGSPRFSVLMPTHTRPDTLGLAIQAVLDQTDPDFELLVVGDGAVEGTAAVVGRFHDPRIRWFDLPKAPHFGYANRNVALRESRGELVAFAPDDDLWFPDHLSELGRAFVDDRVQLAYSQALWVSRDGIAAPMLANLHLRDERERFLTVGNVLAAGAVAYRASAFPTRAPWPEQTARQGDWQMWRELICRHQAGSIRYVRKPTMLHFVAARKKSRDGHSPALATYLTIADEAEWWPPVLRPPVPQGASEQSVYAAAMQADPAAWVEAARDASADVVARIAWDDVQFLRRIALKAMRITAPLRAVLRVARRVFSR